MDSTKIQKLIDFFLTDLENRYGSDGCNDLPKEIKELFTEEEWLQINREFEKHNSGEEWNMKDHADARNYNWVLLIWLRNHLCANILPKK